MPVAAAKKLQLLRTYPLSIKSFLCYGNLHCRILNLNVLAGNDMGCECCEAWAA